MARIPTAMRPWEAVHVEVHASQTEPELCGLHVLSRHGLPRCFWPRSRRRCPFPASHAYEPRLALATARSDVLAGVTGLRRVRSLHFLDPPGYVLLQPGHQQTPTGLEDAPVEAGLLCDVAARVLHGPPHGPGHTLTLRFSTRITSKRRARLVVVFSTQSLRRSPSLDFKAPIRVLTLRRWFDPRAARASLRCSRSNRPASFAPKPLGLVICPVDSASATATPRSTPTTPPVPGAGIGSGITASAICQRPARSAVMRYDFQSMSARLRLKQTHPIFAHQHTAACPVVAANPQRLGSDDPRTLMLAGFTPRRAPVRALEEPLPCLVKVTQRLLLDGLRTAGKPRLRGPGLGQLCGLGVETRRGTFPARPHQVLFESEVPHVPGVAALLGQEHFLCGVRVQAEPHGTQRSLGDRHPGGKQTPTGVVAAPPMISTSTWRSPPNTAVACSIRSLLNLCEQVMAQVCVD